jgi:cytochrome P450
MTAVRALALLATHPDERRRACDEIDGWNGSDDLPFLRACLLDTVRLWPTTPMILRQTSADTTWNGQRLPTGAGVLIFTPFFHRDPARLAFADRFAPDIWLDKLAGAAFPDAALVPFSAGSAICPGRHVVLLLASVLLGEILRGSRITVRSRQRLSSDSPLPATLNHFALCFSV